MSRSVYKINPEAGIVESVELSFNVMGTALESPYFETMPEAIQGLRVAIKNELEKVTREQFDLRVKAEGYVIMLERLEGREV